MKKALFVTLLYSVALVLLGSASIRLPEKCSSFKDFRGLEPSSQIAHGPEFEGYVAAPPEIQKPEPPKLQVCSLTIIPIFWTVHYQCAADAFGGGGGRAFR